MQADFDLEAWYASVRNVCDPEEMWVNNQCKKKLTLGQPRWQRMQRSQTKNYSFGTTCGNLVYY
jgi:hypothetical protein